MEKDWKMLLEGQMDEQKKKEKKSVVEERQFMSWEPEGH